MEALEWYFKLGVPGMGCGNETDARHASRRSCCRVGRHQISLLISQHFLALFRQSLVQPSERVFDLLQSTRLFPPEQLIIYHFREAGNNFIPAE